MILTNKKKDTSAFHLAVAKKKNIIQEPFHIFLQKRHNYEANNAN